MKILIWNCRRLGNPRKVQDLLSFIKQQDPDLVFVSETKCSVNSLKKVQSKCGFSRSWGVTSNGKSGGLGLLWNECILSSSFHHIDAEIGCIGDKEHWRFTSFYGAPNTSDRPQTWNLLRSLVVTCSLIWLCRRDFNEILRLSEKGGGHACPMRQILAFQEIVANCRLVDLRFTGNLFTWKTTRRGGIKERLDCVFANALWKALFSASKVTYLKSGKSDHIPIMVELHQPPPKRPHRLCRFEEMWTQHEECENVVRHAWCTEVEGYLMYQGCEKIIATRVALLKWQRDTFKARQFEIESIRDQITSIDAQTYTASSIEMRKGLMLQFDSLLMLEELYRRQRSKVNWMRSSDQNTRFFHQRASFRRQKNRLSGHLDINGVWQSNDQKKEQVVIDYFSSIFSTNGQWYDSNEDVLVAIECRVTPEMNEVLNKSFTVEEVKNALFQMHPSKFPGPDKMSPLFFHKYWLIVGADVSNAVLSILVDGRMLKKINYTYVALIPKQQHPCEMSQLRHISLCNVLYKIISKTIANRLKSLLPQIISPNQSAFVPGRNIADNSILASEIATFLHSRRMGKMVILCLNST